ncbi:helix-turn-helix domain-containing protein [Bisgaard Taxon 10/6]|uniref:Helix-turn-helix domain-containing protein n=1 Tax=Exercitatus varius TaxID=67857 RepID=A0ABT6ETT1_9PAST|nr:helix-turn-helix domain-containing protein [Exercitatus varius]MDG2945978.1 helix-turn-helix domain-containing protein [Exercitatus varius]
MDKILNGQSPTAMSRDEKIEKIRFMEQKGLFLMKGSIEKAAEKLGVNKVTVYSYLDEVRGKR